VCVVAFDIAGNSVVEDVEVVLDSVPPRIELWPMERQVSQPFVYVNGSVDEDGIEFVAINEVPYPIEDRQFHILLTLNGGYNHFEVSVRDRAGNWAYEEFAIYLWTIRPFLEINEVRDLGNGRFLIRGACSEYIDNVTIDDVVYPVIDSEFWVEIEVAPGTERVFVSVEDPEGNMATTWVDLGTSGDRTALALAVIVTLVIAGAIAIFVLYNSWRAGRQG